ncbi:MAG: DUF2218 domain-containing protein [Pseudomonadota bacterium]
MNKVARFETDSAQRYLETLCQHFGRKVETHCARNTGWVRFPFGRCDMTADVQQLEMVAEAKDATALDQVVDVVTRHLERYAFRENPRLEWHTTSVAEPSPAKQGF